MKDKELKLYMAYDGTKMHLFGWSRPVVVDLKHLTIPSAVPILAPTEEGSLSRTDICNAFVLDDCLWIHTKRDRPEYGYSIGVEVISAELVETGSRTVNGETIEAPFYLVGNSTLREIAEQPNEGYATLRPYPSSEKMEAENKNLKEQVENYRKLVSEYERIKTNNEREITCLANALDELVEAASAFCIRHQQFATLHEKVNSAKVALGKNE